MVNFTGISPGFLVQGSRFEVQSSKLKASLVSEDFNLEL
jgi:hypothetical protein